MVLCWYGYVWYNCYMSRRRRSSNHLLVKFIVLVFAVDLVYRWAISNVTVNRATGVQPSQALAGVSHGVGNAAWLIPVVLGLIVVGVIAVRGTGQMGRIFSMPTRSRRPRCATAEDFYRLSPTEFEQAVSDMLTELGYRGAHRIGGSGDLGVDVECYDERGQKVIAQCKRYNPSHRVGTPEIQLFIGMAYTHHCVAPGCALYFTTASFSGPAVTLAAQHQIALIDGEGLNRIVSGLRQTA